jgi:solute:Na+ symporter, SSS family
MTAGLISLLFETSLIVSLLIALILSLAYLLKGGYKADLYTDAVQFFVMFFGFILIVYFSVTTYGGTDYLVENLPADHLKLTGGASTGFIIVWFLIALWTFADPGFHQRCYAAKNSNVAVKGILISIIFWALFDFLTTATGLFSRAALPDLNNPVLAFPLYAEKILTSGYKGIFYAALFATILSTANSFLFLSGTTISRDFIYKLKTKPIESDLKKYTIYGMLISGVLSITIAFFIPSVISIWYTIGSFCIPGIILPVISSYYDKIRVKEKFIFLEMITAFGISVTWYLIREYAGLPSPFSEIEPMIAGLFSASLIHLSGLADRYLYPFSKGKE